MLQHVVRDFRIIDETDDYIVVDKPPFLLTHPTKPDQRTTLWKELRELLAFEIATAGRSQSSIVSTANKRTYPRRENGRGRAAVRIAHAEHRLHKEYLAIVWGWPEWETKIVDAPLDRQGKHQASAIWLKQMIHPDGAPALTEFEWKSVSKSVAPLITPHLALRAFLSPRGERKAVKAKQNSMEISLLSSARFPGRGARTRFGCISPRSATRSS